MLATPSGVSGTASSAVPCRGAIPGHRTSRSEYTRGLSRETGSLSRLFGSVETTAKCVSVGPAHCRERLQNPVWFSSASIQRDESHSGGPRAGSGNGTRSRNSLKRVRKRAHSPPLPSILLANVQPLDNKKDDLRARISFQRDIRDCNIICLNEIWLTPSVPDTAVTPSDNFSVLRMDRTAEAGKSKGGGVCFMTNKKWCDPRNISSLSRSCSPHLEHLSIICRPFYLPREFSAVIATAVYIPPQADTGLALSNLHDVLSG